MRESREGLGGRWRGKGLEVLDVWEGAWSGLRWSLEWAGRAGRALGRDWNGSGKWLEGVREGTERGLGWGLGRG